MSVKVEKTENKNELKLEFTVEAKVFDEAMKTVFTKNAKYLVFVPCVYFEKSLPPTW